MTDINSLYNVINEHKTKIKSLDEKSTLSSTNLFSSNILFS